MVVPTSLLMNLALQKKFPGYEFPDIDLVQAELLLASSMALYHLYGKSQYTAIT